MAAPVSGESDMVCLVSLIAEKLTLAAFNEIGQWKGEEIVGYRGNGTWKDDG